MKNKDVKKDIVIKIISDRFFLYGKNKVRSGDEGWVNEILEDLIEEIKKID